MGKLKALDENFNLTNKRIILRIDLNVPIQAGKVTDESRIKKVIPIIKELTNRKAKIILISHLSRPKGKIDEKLSLRPVTPILKNLLNSEVYFSEENRAETNHFIQILTIFSTKMLINPKIIIDVSFLPIGCSSRDTETK